jgi:Na+/glutamate symporter
MQAIVAFLLLAALYALGDYIGTKSKAWIPSVFVVACLFLLGYWTFFPKDIVNLAGMGAPLGGTLAILFCITHMGTVISVKELCAQWKIIVVTLVGLLGMIILCYFVCVPLVGKEYVVAGLPPLTGGIVAAVMMQQAALQKGLESASVLAICMYVMQGFAGYPLTAILLKKEGKNLLAKYRKGEVSVIKNIKVEESNGKLATLEQGRKKLFPPVPDKYNGTALILAKMASVATLAYLIQKWTNGVLNQAVVALILSIVATEIGYLDKDSLHKAGSFGFLMFVLMIFIFSGLAKATPAMLGQIALPLVVIIVVGVVGMVIFALVAGKLLHISPYMAVATSLTALYGFPPNYVLTDEAAKALAETPEEKEYLMNAMLPQMIVGGFVTVTITSVIVAGICVNLL